MRTGIGFLQHQCVMVINRIDVLAEMWLSGGFGGQVGEIFCPGLFDVGTLLSHFFGMGEHGHEKRNHETSEVGLGQITRSPSVFILPYPNTTHGTGIYAAPLTPAGTTPTDRQIWQSPGVFGICQRSVSATMAAVLLTSASSSIIEEPCEPGAGRAVGVGNRIGVQKRTEPDMSLYKGF